LSGFQVGGFQEVCTTDDGSYDFSALDGYDEIKYAPSFPIPNVFDTRLPDILCSDHPEAQAKIRQAVEQGHIDPKDFNGVCRSFTLCALNMLSSFPSRILRKTSPERRESISRRSKRRRSLLRRRRTKR
jgi:hypothetical protein